jgi:DNA repair and recombination protein RAD54B
MGLGKTLSAITLIHTILTNSSMPCHKDGNLVVKSVLVVVPKNTISHWESEFGAFTCNLKQKILVDSIVHYQSQAAQQNALQRWQDRGGVLLVTEGKLHSLSKKGSVAQPDCLVIDEAHSMLKTTTNKVFQTLSQIDTPRKVLLTGTPFQNNLMEYFRMVSYIRPNLFPGITTEAEFDLAYCKPIQEGEVGLTSH